MHKIRIASAMTLLSLLAFAAAATAGESAVNVNASKPLKALLKQTKRLPKLSKRATLVARARHARAVAKTAPCDAVRDLALYRKTLTRTTSKRARIASRLAALSTKSTKLTIKLLADQRTQSCGGGVTAPTTKAVTTTVESSTAEGMAISVDLPRVGMVEKTADGKSWTKLVLPNTDSSGTPGTPGIPVSSSTIAVPDGATLDVKASDVESYTLKNVELYPVQPDPVDQGGSLLKPKPDFFGETYSDSAFKFDAKSYGQDAKVPAAPALGKLLGQARDLNIAGLQYPAAQYNPKTDTLKVITHVDVDVTFNGGPHTFSPATGSPWETSQHRFAASLLNAEVVRGFGRDIIYQPCGEELLVITNPSTLASANTYATARRAAGFLTKVVQTGSVAVGNTAAQIQTYIRGQLNHPLCIRPSYVTIIGDDELVPTFTTGPGGIPSDNPYSTKDNLDELPDVAVGRMLGADPAQLDALIAKIVHYETTPPAGPMLNRAIMAAQFQDTDDVGEVNDGREDRTFIQFAETVRNGLTARGVTVNRIYADNPTTNPMQFNDGTPLPVALQKPTFAWDGDGTDVSAAWNEGRFMVVHRDHGWSDGWGDPYFTTTGVDALTNDNDNLPVVLSINCASAQYDTDETSFVQQSLIKPVGGAVGAFGDTRNSPSWHNSQIALGFVDAMLPSVLGGEGPASKMRVGDALVHGKLRLAGIAPPSGPGIVGGDGNTRNELYLWHYFGDPTMQMFGGGHAPIIFNPAVFAAAYKELPVPKPGDPPPFEVNLTFPAGLGLAGQPVSLLRNGEVIGKAIAGDGSVKVQASFTGDSLPKPGELEIAIDADDAAPVTIPVEGGTTPEPTPTPTATQPDLVITSLTATQVTVENQGTGPAPAFTTRITDSQNQSLDVSFGALAAGKSATQSYDCGKLLRSRTATADSDNAVAESKEDNNTASGVYSCPPPPVGKSR